MIGPDLVRGVPAAPGGGRAGGSRGPGVLAGLVTVRQVPRHLLQGWQDQVRGGDTSHFTLTDTVNCVQDLRPPRQLHAGAGGRECDPQEGFPPRVDQRQPAPPGHRLHQAVRATSQPLHQPGPQTGTLRHYCSAVSLLSTTAGGERDAGREPRNPDPLLRRGQQHSVPQVDSRYLEVCR